MLVNGHHEFLPMVAFMSCVALALAQPPSPPPGASSPMMVPPWMAMRHMHLLQEYDKPEAHPFNRGTALLLNRHVSGNLERAVQCFKKALAVGPRDTDAYNNLAVAYLYQGKTADAVDSLKRCLRINPNYAGAYFNLTIAYHRLGKYSEAEECARAAVRLLEKPELRAIAYYNLGYVLDEQKRYAEAIEAFDQAAKLGQNDKAQIGRAVAQAHLGRLEEAIATLEQLRASWTAHVPRNAGPPAHFMLNMSKGPLVGLLDNNLALMEQELEWRRALERWRRHQARMEQLRSFFTVQGRPLTVPLQLLTVLAYALQVVGFGIRRQFRLLKTGLLQLWLIIAILALLSSREPQTSLFCVAATVVAAIQGLWILHTTR